MLPRPRRYGPMARWYDVLSFERLVYRAGRVAAIDRLGLAAGARVLDVGCGTGLNFPLVLAAIGSTGALVGVDASQQMLERAEARIDRGGWVNIRIVRGDVGQLAALPGVEGGFDAMIFSYSLSVIGPWTQAWRQGLQLLAPGGRIAVVDTAMPTGRWRWLGPLAALAMFTGGVKRQRRPWSLLDQDAMSVSHEVLRGGHVHVAVGTVRTTQWSPPASRTRRSDGKDSEHRPGYPAVGQT